MKANILILSLLSLSMAIQAQFIPNPNVAIKPIGSLTITAVELTDSTTTVYIRITGTKPMQTFTLRTRDLFIRPVSDPYTQAFIRDNNAPFAPKTHVFQNLNETLEFSLVFQALPKGTKYFDLMENMPKREFYVQGIILDPKLNEMVTRGFESFSRADGNGALKAFIEMANADLYFEYGLAYFNIIYLLASANRIPEAKEWYAKFQDRFFYDKKLLENELGRLGILQKLR